MHDQERLLGISDLQSRMAASGLNIVEQSPWPHLRATYFEIGKAGRTTDIVLSDEFLQDLPRTKEYQLAVETYARAVSGRVHCGPPNLFYCASNHAISVSIRWPVQGSVFQDRFQAWLLATVTDEENGSIARCCVDVNRQVAADTRTTFDEVRNSINGVRRAIDGKAILFYPSAQSHPEPYQGIDESHFRARSGIKQSDIESFIAGKTRLLAFQIPEVPGETFVADPWDAEYLGVSKKELSQAAYVLRARGLVDLDPSLTFARPADKLITAGWPAKVDPHTIGPEPQVYELSALPKKEQLTEHLNSLRGQGAATALVFLDLDRFKEVNDTKGHSEGDACLGRVVAAIGAVLGRKGTLYRWGGDEFAITLPDFSTDEALVTAERIRRAIQDSEAGGDIPVTASIGVCGTDVAPKASAQDLIDTADKAMYASKRAGKNRVRAYPAELEGNSEPTR